MFYTYQKNKICKTAITKENPLCCSNPDRITLNKEDVCQKKRASSVFKGSLEVLTESPVKRIWLDFYGYLTEMFYTCFTLSIKCFTLLVV